ncbi:sensor histidine kinase [Stigmatella hybrida]|uniref:sensor histidine kinase n=1 Tax=Stigmatella hybrida TaxID=394097 RepID=UPI001CDB2AF5|nr:ATP-binding protein [Stigmatella hybrida]
MKWRIASVAFLLGSLATGLSWLTLLPTLLHLMDVARRWVPSEGVEAAVLSRVRGFLPFALGLDLLVLVILAYIVLEFTVGRPLRATELAVGQLERLELDLTPISQGGPFLSRIQSALNRMAEALRREQALTRSQLEALRQANARLSRAQTELVSAERLATVGRLAAGVAHEVGNPLAGILGYLSLARMRASTAELKDFLDRIDHEVHRIDGIVRGLLDLGRPRSGPLAPVDLGQVVETCVRLVRAGPELSRVEVGFALAPGLLARADPGPLSQIVINLLLNAAQAMGGQGAVRVSTGREANEVWLMVEDTGPGLTAEVMARLFEPFFTTKEGKGTGLGLAVSLHLAQGMGGKLTAENAPGGGARFTLRLTAA